MDGNYGRDHFDHPFKPEQWEPKSPEEWISRDPFKEAGLNISSEFRVKDQISAFNAWSHMPQIVRRQVWREREIAARLFLTSHDWNDVQGLHSIGVGKRQEGTYRQLAGIVMVESAWAKEPELVHGLYDIPQFIEVPSQIPEEKEEIPLRVEYTTAPRQFNIGIVPPEKFILASNSLPMPASTPTLMAGEVVFSENLQGFRRPGTLSAIVSRETDPYPLLLSAAHVFGDRRWRVFSKGPNSAEVGQVIDIDSGLDAAIAELREPYIVDYRVRDINIIPAAPVMPYSDMPVQIVGGVSGNQLGWLDLVNSIPVGSEKIGVIPHFRASIQANPGDSGALLLSGHGGQCPLPPDHLKNAYPGYKEIMTCAMLGILVAGPSSSPSITTRPQAYFTPIFPILNRFKLQAWVRDIRG